MSKPLVEIEGFAELQQKIKRLPEKLKKREVNKILMQVANSTVAAAQGLAPVSKTAHIQKRKGQSYGTWITPGTGKRSIAKKVMTKATEPMVTVSPRSKKSADGWYLRQFVIPGTKYIKGNNFMDRAFEQTKGGVVSDLERRMAKYIQKNINKLN